MIETIHNFISNNINFFIIGITIIVGVMLKFGIDLIAKKYNLDKDKIEKLEQQAIIAQNAISMVLNHISQIDDLPITGKQKKQMVCTYITQTLGNLISDYIKRHHGSIQAFVEFVFRTMFKK